MNQKYKDNINKQNKSEKDHKVKIKNTKNRGKDQDKNLNSVVIDTRIEREEEIVKIDNVDQDKGLKIENKKNIIETVNREMVNKSTIKNIKNIKTIKKNIKKIDPDQEIDNKNQIIEIA